MIHSQSSGTSERLDYLGSRLSCGANALAYVGSRKTGMITHSPRFNVGVEFSEREHTGVRLVVDRFFCSLTKEMKDGFYFNM